MTRVLTPEMWVPFHLGDPNQRYADFLAIARPRFHRLLESILLHDKIIVPTHDFMGATILVGVLGADAVRELLECDIMRFIRVKGALCYIGNGGGLRVFQIRTKDGTPRPPWASTDEAVSWALSGLNDNFDQKHLERRILDRTDEIDLGPLEDDIRHETYTEIQRSNTLINWFAERSEHLDKLAGIGPKNVRIFGGYESKTHENTEISTVLQLAQVNLELRLAGITLANDLNTAAPISDDLDLKLERLKPPGSEATAASRFFEIAGVPNVGEAILTKAVAVEALVRLRHTSDGKAFRDWFHEHASEDTAEMARSYISLLTRVPAIQTTPGKTLRWVVSTGIGMIPIVGNVLGPIIGAADTFLSDKLQKPSPKFFVEKLVKLLPPIGASDRSP